MSAQGLLVPMHQLFSWYSGLRKQVGTVREEGPRATDAAGQVGGVVRDGKAGCTGAAAPACGSSVSRDSKDHA